jgi:hypothetical protein
MPCTSGSRHVQYNVPESPLGSHQILAHSREIKILFGRSHVEEKAGYKTVNTFAAKSRSRLRFEGMNEPSNYSLRQLISDCSRKYERADMQRTLTNALVMIDNTECCLETLQTPKVTIAGAKIKWGGANGAPAPSVVC